MCTCNTKNDPHPFCTWCDVDILHNIGSTSEPFIETYFSYYNKTACKCSHYYYDENYICMWHTKDNLWKAEEIFNYSKKNFTCFTNHVYDFLVLTILSFSLSHSISLWSHLLQVLKLFSSKYKGNNKSTNSCGLIVKDGKCMKSRKYLVTFIFLCISYIAYLTVLDKCKYMQWKGYFKTRCWKGIMKIGSYP